MRYRMISRRRETPDEGIFGAQINFFPLRELRRYIYEIFTGTILIARAISVISNDLKPFVGQLTATES